MNEKQREPNINFHSNNILLTLLLIGLTAMFFALTVAYIYSRIQSNIQPIKIPNLFLFNTLIILASDVTMNKVYDSYFAKDKPKLFKFLNYSLVFALLFVLVQYIAWKQLIAQNIHIHTSSIAAYVYLISGLHAVHVLAGLPFVIWYYLESKKSMKSDELERIYFADISKKIYLKLLIKYWRFLSGLWVYLVLFFFINYWF
ncbi:MAG: cytochrome c oxidase subunit 3 [Saprospiraceae bacterium]|nr:cytochrome c oxidase subunit 3 [Saprospiraceae bacterium]